MNLRLRDLEIWSPEMPNRTVCSVLSEMRECTKTQNYSYLLGLIEEVQTLVNRMEASLFDKKDMKYDIERHRKLKKEIKEMSKKIEDNSTSSKKSKEVW